jgi:hypothetical protein
MYKAIDTASQFRDEFLASNRADQFSYEALGMLFDYLEEADSNYELDIVAICCEYAEETVGDIAINYSIDLSELDPEAGDYEEQCRQIVYDYLSDRTSVVGDTASGFVYAQF